MDDEKVEQVLENMDTSPFVIDVLVNCSSYVNAFVDSGCLCLSAFSSRFVHDRKLPRIEIEPRLLKLAENDRDYSKKISYITFIDMDIDGRRERIFGYIIKELMYDMILGKPWMERNGIVYHAAERMLTFADTPGLEVFEAGWVEKRASKEVVARIAQMELSRPS